MKPLMMMIAITAIFAACNNDKKSEDTTTDTTKTNVTVPTADARPASINEVVAGYLNVKNALTNDNGREAATAANEITNTLGKMDTASLKAEQKKIFHEIKEEILEHATHISTNGDKIDHQRSHFDFLSRDMYDLLKIVPADKILYKDHCPMYNDNKGATWLSEFKEIKNPYLGSKMLTCGTVKEEIKN